MRLLIDSLIGIMVLAVVAGVVVLHTRQKGGEKDLAATWQSLEALHDQAAYHASIQSAMAGREQVVVYVDPDWFDGQTPVNKLVDTDRPWLDLAPPGDLESHPPDPVIYHEKQASFWFNPTLGVFRARVIPQLSEAKTLELYNQVNSCELFAFDDAPSPARTPMAHLLDQPPSKHYASLAAGWDAAAPEVQAEFAQDVPAVKQASKNTAAAADEDDLNAAMHQLYPNMQATPFDAPTVIYEVPEESAPTTDAHRADPSLVKGNKPAEPSKSEAPEAKSDAANPRPTLKK